MKKISDRLKQVSQIFRAYSQPVPVDQPYFKERIAICDPCEWNSANIAPEKLSVADKNKIKVFFKGEPMCTACGCCIPLKAGLRDSVCGLKSKGKKPKWDTAFDKHSKVYGLANKSLIANNLTPDEGVLSPMDGGFKYKVNVLPVDSKMVELVIKITDIHGFSLINQITSCGCTAAKAEAIDDKSCKLTYQISTLKILEGGKLDIFANITYGRRLRKTQEVIKINIELEREDYGQRSEEL